MLIGIDVGGTYTDGVLFSEGEVVHTVKHPTDQGHLKETLLAVLDELLAAKKDGRIQRVVLSTTLVTNLLAWEQGERTALLLLPGPGLPFSAYHMSPDTSFLKGGMDFRGREIEKPDVQEVQQVLQQINGAGIRRIAVAGKFSNRNDGHEMLVKELANSSYPHMDVYTSNRISGRLNFPRRAATCYFTAMTSKEWNSFADDIETAIKERVPDCDLHILKADGGTMTLAASRGRPCETVFSGPAASTMAGAALRWKPVNAVVVDIGGTTSDISLLIDGQPLYASKGAFIGGHLTHIHSFAVDSIALGGDSSVSEQDGLLHVGPRVGPAVCFGGPTPTVTDAFNVLLQLGIGNHMASLTAVREVAVRLNQSPEALCQAVADHTIDRLAGSIQDMFRQWEDEPAYKVWEVVNRRKFVLHEVVGIGAAAPAIVPLLAQRLGVPHFLHPHSPVANALGAALARPTLAVEIHIDTQKGIYTVSPGGIRERLDDRDLQIEDACQMARHYLQKIGAERGLPTHLDDARFYMQEQFNVIRGWSRTSKVFDVGIEIKPGFVREYKGVAR